ncbi:MAG TPA: tRNA 2-thiouridine(34) synthase MnmA, partial [Spirochaetales bacterium]|nr:tRNA 2-thiouridine(34) synthase MnmA [Spirochaetales bacterium]
NPCVRCNRDLKFGFMLERASEAAGGLDRFATGHYARIAERNGIMHLKMALDLSKDQTYFMHRIKPELLSTLCFPLGELTKADARILAAQRGLAAADKPESQDFIAGGYESLFNDETPGDIVDASGTVIGRHRGLAHYTIGQRRGIGVSAGPIPMYVAELDPVNNRVVLSSDASLFASGLTGRDAFTVDPTLSVQPFQALVRIRQNHKPARAQVVLDGNRAQLRFELPQRAIAPGQSAVFYDEDGFVLGGCVIESKLDA